MFDCMNDIIAGFPTGLTPRAQALLFIFLRPKGLNVVSYVEFTAESKYDMLAKIKLERFSETSFFVTLPQNSISMHQQRCNVCIFAFILTYILLFYI